MGDEPVSLTTTAGQTVFTFSNKGDMVITVRAFPGAWCDYSYGNCLTPDSLQAVGEAFIAAAARLRGSPVKTEDT